MEKVIVSNINTEAVTVGDLMDSKEMKGMAAVINDGKLVGFEYEK